MPLMLFRRNTFTFWFTFSPALLWACLVFPLSGCVVSTVHFPVERQAYQSYPAPQAQPLQVQQNQSSHPSHDDVGCAASNIPSDMLSRVNHIRATGAVCGGVHYPPVAPLRWNTKLQQAAAVHSQDMAMHNFFNHKSASNGTTLPERLRSVGYKYQSAGENIGAGPTTVAQVVDMWVASPGHCVILMTANFAELGASCKNNSNSHYKTYWTLKAATPS
jgi:uncharacterized protein YkwD